MSDLVVLLNGPINSGKDFIGLQLQKRLGCHLGMFKKHLYECTAQFYEVDYDWFVSKASDRIEKEIPLIELDGKSPREALIHVSEDVYKPKYGKEYFGNKFVEDLRSGVTVVTDSGFVEEATRVVETLGNTKVLLVRIHRDGAAYSSSDSRSYISLADQGVLELDLDNNRHIDDVVQDVLNFMGIKE